MTLLPAAPLAPLLALLLSCGDRSSDTADATCCTGSSDPAFQADEPWELVPITPLTTDFDGASAPRQVMRAAGNDTVYAIDDDGTHTQIITPSWLQPEGRHCVDGGGSGYDCWGGDLVTSGVIETQRSPAACIDDVDDVLLLVKEGGATVDLVRTNRAGESWKSYNRAETSVLVGKDADDRLDGACAARAGRVAMSGDDAVVILDPDWQAELRIPLTGPLEDLAWVGDAGWLVGRSPGGSIWAIDSVQATAQLVVPPTDTNLLAVDADRSTVWIGGAGRIVGMSLTAEGAGPRQALDLCGRVTDLAVDQRTGALHALTLCSEAASGHELVVLDRHGIRASVALDDDPVALVPPGAMGQAAVLVRTQPGRDTADNALAPTTEVRAWAVVDPDDTRPPLSMFVVTTLEQPFTNATMACTQQEDSSTNFESYIQKLRQNIPLVAETGLPVAVGVTWEFATKARQCGVDDVLDELSDAGFSLGTMVHDRPCFSCTDGLVAGETPQACDEDHVDYAAPDDETACWPSDPDYCNPGDSDCWFDWVAPKALDVDEWIPGGSQFIFGADRHRMWDFEYIADGYRRFPRADGSTGYRISLFQGAWVYDDITDVEDPRAKDPAPWSPELLGNTWFPADTASWEEDSAFSDMLYMPGNSNALSRLYDLELSDLSLVHLIEEVEPLTVTREDADTLFARIMQAVAHRTDRPGTFYFHLADLSGYTLIPSQGDTRIDQQQLLFELKAQVEDYYGEGGLGVVQWEGPLEARQRVDDWLDQE